jgi:hypothetical protein
VHCRSDRAQCARGVSDQRTLGPGTSALGCQGPVHQGCQGPVHYRDALQGLVLPGPGVLGCQSSVYGGARARCTRDAKDRHTDVARAR